MFDVVTYALLKKAIGQAATGISQVEYKEGKLVFTLADGSIIETPLDIQSSDVRNIFVNEDGALVVEFNDNTSLIFAPATKEDLAAVAEKIDSLEISHNELAASHNNLYEAHNVLEKDFYDLGLSIVDGKLNITYNKGE